MVVKENSIGGLHELLNVQVGCRRGDDRSAKVGCGRLAANGSEGRCAVDGQGGLASQGINEMGKMGLGVRKRNFMVHYRVYGTLQVIDCINTPTIFIIGSPW